MSTVNHTYIRVKWLHTFSDEPIELLSELDEGRMEIRKIEYFKKTKVGVASKKISRNGTRLGTEPVPEIERINEDRQFQATEIDRGEFESEWECFV